LQPKTVLDSKKTNIHIDDLPKRQGHFFHSVEDSN